MSAVLITGATGLLGTEITSSLLKERDETIYVLVRAENNEAAIHRLKACWYPLKDLYNAIGTRILPAAGDVTEENLGISEELREILQEEVSTVIHAAAQVSLQKEEEELRKTNVEGTGKVIAFAESLKHLNRFVFISTAYTAGTRTGTILESDLPSESFSTLYEKSKADAEMLVRNSHLPYTICRPGMIAGNSKTGWTRNFNTIYYLLKLILLKKLPVIPADANMGLNVIPADYAAGAVMKTAFEKEAEGKTFHLTCPAERQPKAGALAAYVCEWAEAHLDTKIAKPRFIELKAFLKAGRAYNLKQEDKKKSIFTNLLALAPYFSAEQTFDRTNTDALCGEYDTDWHDYIDILLEFACRRNFMSQSGHTVFEQAAVRNASKRHPVNYYDVSADGIHKVSGTEVNERIRRIVDAMYAWGIRKGDKIAIAGINSVEYMTIDQAIGLSGAVSVPIYYTTPVDEVQQLLERSGARWLFAGDRRIMRNIEKLDPSIRVVVFSDGLNVHKSNVMHWEQFLYEAKEKAPKQYADPEDLATIRYTSGTTGDPKGVKFNYSQLAWMGEVLTDLLPWQERNKSMRYLSFLPLSHVVEGILASYAPYYLLADTDFYYLNDFQTLTEALPKVRPTVFFSVPRFYEKLWDQVCANKYGQKWLNMKKGPARDALGVLLKKIVLKKAGLDACGQLIVGSAPISEELLRSFRDLGIEIYNAYGQAEAPLITINRLNDNVIPTIGTPLPETEVTIAEDGELIVKGPQVTLGYYGMETDTIKDGVLKTGDLGSILENGHIILQGRKKEMIITAYGKNISIPKIESRLKDIPGVSEAVLIGEKRPYCTALLWLEREIPDLAERIEAMNNDLSHPETIRKYTVIQRPLSIAEKELTPNLKVRRAYVAEHFKKEIEEMYL